MSEQLQSNRRLSFPWRRAILAALPAFWIIGFALPNTNTIAFDHSASPAAWHFEPSPFRASLVFAAVLAPLLCIFIFGRRRRWAEVLGWLMLIYMSVLSFC